MNEICSIKNTDIDKIALIFCSKCQAVLDKNSKTCKNLKCSKVFCSECITSNKCPNRATKKKFFVRYQFRKFIILL